MDGKKIRKAITEAVRVEWHREG